MHHDRIEHLPLSSLQARVAVLVELNRLIGKVLPLVDLSRSAVDSRLACLLRRFRGLILWPYHVWQAED